MHKLLLILFFCGSSLLLKGQGFSYDEIEYPYEVQRLDLGDTLNIAYVEEGAGEETILFIHGLGGYLPIWKKNIENLKQDFRCLALDLPGFGKSSKKEFSYSIPFFVKTIKAFLNHQSIEKVHLVGHSLGGQIALHYNLQYPNEIESLILMASTGMESFTEDQISLMKTFVSPQSIKNMSPSRIKSDLAGNFYQKKLPEEAQFMLDDRLRLTSAPDFNFFALAVSRSVAAILDAPLMNELKNVQTPTLIVFGEDDQLIPNRYFNPELSIERIAKKTEEALADSQFEIIKEAGHMLPFEQAEKVNVFIREFLEKNK